MNKRLARVMAIGAAMLTIVAGCSSDNTGAGSQGQNPSGSTPAGRTDKCVNDKGQVAITDDLIAAAKAEGSVAVDLGFPVEGIEPTVKAFKDAYPGIDVVWQRAAGADAVAKLIQDYQAGVRRLDVFHSSDLGASRDLVSKGVIADLTPGNVDQYPEDYIVAPGLYSPSKNISVVAYNTKSVTSEQASELKDWKAVLDPKWQGKVSVVPPDFGFSMVPLLYVLNNKDLGVPFVEKLHEQKPVIFNSSAPARDAMLAGQPPVAWFQWEPVMLGLIESGAPVAFKYPEPTPQWPSSVFGVVSNAPHPNAACLYWAWSLSQAGCEVGSRAPLNNPCSLKGVEDTRASMKKVAALDWYEPVKNVWTPDLDEWATKGSEYQKQWYQIMGLPTP